MTLAGLSDWEDYEMSAEVEALMGEAGLVFHAQNTSDFYYFSIYDDGVNTSSCQAWRYADGSSRSLLTPLTAVTVNLPMELRVICLDATSGRFLCYANSTHVEFTDTSYDKGQIGLRIETGGTGTATFDNVAIHGQNAFLAEDGSHEVLFADPMNRIDIDGTPYMWCLLWDWDLLPDTVGGHGKYLRGTYIHDTQNPLMPEAWRGEEGWTDYHVLADVRLDNDNAEAKVYFRHRYSPYPGYPDPGYEYYSCVLSYDGQGKLDVRKHWLRWQGGTQYVWDDKSLLPLQEPVTIFPFVRDSWHLVEVGVRDIVQGQNEVTEIQCRVNGVPRCTCVDDGTVGLFRLEWGRVGLAVGARTQLPEGTETASFDNVVVLEE